MDLIGVGVAFQGVLIRVGVAFLSLIVGVRVGVVWT